MIGILIIFVYFCKCGMFDVTFSRWRILPAEPLRDGPFNFQGGGGAMLFSKKIF
jgi:hypothetical protein